MTTITWSPVAKANAFPKDFRLRKSAEFSKIYEKGVKRVSRSFVVFLLPNALDHCRFGLTTPRKLGKAHDRNRVRRKVREVLRQARAEFPTGFDVVVNPKRSVLDRKFDELQSELKALLGAET